jgi:hypothetical protein
VSAVRTLASLGQRADSIASDLGLSVYKVRVIADREGILLPGSNAAQAAKWDRARQMAAEGHTSHQIAKALNMTFASFRNAAADHGIEVPADATVGRRRIDHNRAIEQTVMDMDALAMSIAVLGDPTDVDLTLVKDWVISLEQSLKVLTQFKNQLKEMTQ